MSLNQCIFFLIFQSSLTANILKITLLCTLHSKHSYLINILCLNIANITRAVIIYK